MVGDWIGGNLTITLACLVTTTDRESASDEELAGAIGRRDQTGGSMASAKKAFEELHKRFDPPIRTFLLARCSRSEAEDLGQLVWLKVWRSLPKAKPGPFRAWVFKIARHALIDHQRKKRPEELTEGASGSLVDDGVVRPENQLIEQERTRAMERCVKMLKDELATVVRGRLSGEDYLAISRALGIKPGQAHAYFHKAKSLLKACVEKVKT